MLNSIKKICILIAFNLFPDAIAIAVLGIFMELLYRLFSFIGVLHRGLEFFSLFGCLAMAFIIFTLRLPALIKAIKIWRRENPRSE